MGSSPSKMTACNYHYVREFTKNRSGILICTLSNGSCYIPGTTEIEKEEAVINGILKKRAQTQNFIIIYGSNHMDDTVISKYRQLRNMGFRNVYCYLGGMFEWLLLQTVFGLTEFPTIGDGEILDYNPVRTLEV